MNVFNKFHGNPSNSSMAKKPLSRMDLTLKNRENNVKGYMHPENTQMIV